MTRAFRSAREVVIVRGTEGRNPFEVFMLLWSVFVGAAFIFGAPEPGSVQSLLPQWMVTTWYTLLCVGGLVGLVGVWKDDAITSLLVERAGMLIIAPAGLLYSIALFLTAGDRAATAGGITAAFGLAATVRYTRISWQLHVLKSAGKT